MEKEQLSKLVRILLAIVLLSVLFLLPVEGNLRLGLFLIPYLLIGYDILIEAAESIWHREGFDEDFLMSVATIGAILLGDYAEAVAVMLFFQIGEFFEDYAVERSRKNITDLMDIRPDYANIEENGLLKKVSPEEVAIGSTIVVQPGEKVPIDGVILEGRTSLDTSALTGESLPREAAMGEEIISGSINMTGLIRVRTSKAFGESTVSKILELVEDSGRRKSRSEDFITKFARVYTPAVCVGALALAILPPLIRMGALHLAPAWGDWIYRALTFLVISCPCALVISIPLSFFAGIGGAGRSGILIKGANYMEALSQTKTVVCDKTGTLTEGVFEVTGIHHAAMDERTLLEYTALAESASSHPISKSLQRAYGREPDRSRVTDIEEISGNGVTARVDGHVVAAGSTKLMRRLGIAFIECSGAGTVVHVAVDGRYAGHILISDKVKPTAREALQKMRQAGVTRTVMLTGDGRSSAKAVAAELGVDEVYSELLPADKVQKVEDLLKERKNQKEKLAFVGDGINDAPVLTRADIGIAMGAMGSDAAIEAADVVLMDDDPMKVAKAIRISRKCIRIVYENIWFAIGVKAVCLALGALGIANMWMAIFADVGVMVLAVLNAIRALFVKNL